MWTPLRVLLMLTLVQGLIGLALPLPAAEGKSLAVTGAAETASAEQPFLSQDVWDKPAPAAADKQVDLGAAALRMAISLFLVLACLVGTLVLFKRFTRGKTLLQQGGRHLQMLETLPMGMKRSVSLVSLGDQVLVIGQAEGSINHIATFPKTVLDQEQPSRQRTVTTEMEVDDPRKPMDPPLATVTGGEAAVGQFQERLKKLLGKV